MAFQHFILFYYFILLAALHGLQGSDQGLNLQ